VFPNLPCDHQTNGSQQLKLGPPDPTDAQEPIQIVHGQAENFRIAVSIFANFQHPIGDLLPHVLLDLSLDGGKVVPRDGQVLCLLPEQRFQDSIVAKNHWIGVGASSKRRRRRCRRWNQHGHGLFPE
jgi:hypothetical protein